MTLKEVMNQMGGKPNSARITIEEAKMAYESDGELRETVNRIIPLMLSSPLMNLLIITAKADGMSDKELGEFIVRAVIENVLTDKE